MTEKTQKNAAAHGRHTSHGIPHGATSLTPFLAVPNARAALVFYREVFGARIVDVTEISAVVVHAVLDFGHGRLQIGEPVADYHLVPPPAGDDDCYSMGFYCNDVDAVIERAEAAGATVREPLTTFVSGDRFCSIRDPFGIRWTIMTRVEDLSDEDSARRVAEWANEQAPSS